MSLILVNAFSEENLYAIAHLGELDVFQVYFVNLYRLLYRQFHQYHNLKMIEDY